MWLLVTISLLLLLFAAAVCILLFFTTKALTRPAWYNDKTRGHQNRSFQEGLVTTTLGNASTIWRISESIDGMGNPYNSHGMSYQNVEIPLRHSYFTSTNSVLRGWFIPRALAEAVGNNDVLDPPLCVIAVHGGGRDRRAFLRHLPIFHQTNCSVLMFDLEEHGVSDGRQRGVGWCTFEQENVMSAVAYALTLGEQHVVLLGTSMGASACLIAAGLGDTHRRCCHHVEKHSNNNSTSTQPTQYDERAIRTAIVGVIAENPFSTRIELMHQLVMSTVRQILPDGIVSRHLVHLIVQTGLWKVRDATHENPLEAVKQLHVPVLFIHGDKDTLVSVKHSEALYKETASRDKRLWIVPGAIHTATQNINPAKWDQQITALLTLVRRRRQSNNDDT